MKSKILFSNIALIELSKRVFYSGNISVRGVLLLVVYYIKLIVILPATLLQYLFYAKRIKQTVITKPPIFIIGHYRSGTTYLHKLLCADERFGFVSHYDMICPDSSLLFGKRLQNVLQFFINKLKIKTSFFNNTIVSLDEPAEEERFLINKGSAFADYWKFVFPLNQNIWQSNLLNDDKYYDRWKTEYIWLLKMITFKSKGRQLVLKSPCNTERIKYLLKIFPDAKFIYLSRNPYHVFYSTVNLWQKAIQKFCLQHISTSQREEIIFTHYTYLAKQYKKDKDLIPACNLVEVKYEELESKPLYVLQKIYSDLSIGHFRNARNSFINQLQKEKQYNKFRYTFHEETLLKINTYWAKQIEDWKENNFNAVMPEYSK